ncbi:hypothetical protein [Pontivivens ytuae]|uniref:DUF4239 domain-containing protein n=1 Tax=Pontivivens ytuae TaxID=2789856 RepID=A0A7S9LNA8_9RHOB|nr:hypothetical protein [Pontivivens ytuae]QPH52243.1 hypothetical protein I0K15_10385 [Pontivivens ytuae]
MVFVLAVVATITVVCSIQVVGHRVLRHRFTEDTPDFAASIAFRIAALHGLIVALIFAQEMFEYQQLEIGLVQEATAIGDLHYDIARYGGADVEAVRTALLDYTRIAMGPEWVALSEDATLLGAAWHEREAVYEIVLNLEPETARQETLRTHMIADLQLIAELREVREGIALTAFTGLFWLAATAGIVLTTLCLVCYTPGVMNLMLLSIFGGFNGLVLALVYGLSNPFAAPGALEPVAFARVLEADLLAAD